MFWNRKTAENRRDSELLLYIGPFEWQALFVNPQKNISAIFSGDLSSETAAATEQASDMIVAAVSACRFSKNQGGEGRIVNLLELAESIIVIISTGSMVFADSTTGGIHSASPARLREYGAGISGGAETSFCFSRFGKGVEEGEQKGGVYGFLPVTALKAILRPFGEHALKIRQVIPFEHLLLLRSQQTRLYGGVVLGDMFTVIIAANWDNASATVRTLSSGIMHPIRAMASAAAAPLEEIKSAMRHRDMVTKLADRNDAAGLDASARILYEFLIGTAAVIEQTRSFFAVQRASGRIPSFELLGGIQQIKGVAAALNIRLQANGCAADTHTLSITDLYAQTKQLTECNLLKGTLVPLLQLGKKQFAFEQERFRLAVKTEPQEAGRGRHLSRRGRSKANSGQGGMKWFSSFFSGNRRPEEEQQAGKQRDFIYYAGLAILTMLVLYKEYDIYVAEKKAVIGRMGGYESLLNDYAKLRKEADDLGGPRLASVSYEDMNKVLWTEKFLALGRHIDKSLWLTDVYIKKERRILNGVDMETHVLTIEGGALPSTEGHIDRIALFIENLKKDYAMFMDDFKEIIFKGAEREGGEGYSVIKFKIEAIYDKSNRERKGGEQLSNAEEKSFDQLLEEKSEAHYRQINEASNIK